MNLPTLTSLFVESLRCPRCSAQLAVSNSFNCLNPACSATYPCVDGIPILIDEGQSVFNISDFTNRRSTTLELGTHRSLSRKAFDMLPNTALNVASVRNYRTLAARLRERVAMPRIMIVGGSILGCGMAPLMELEEATVLETDVSLGPRTHLVCDAHQLPFANETFDCVVAQAVLEHVSDPYRCVAEFHRVLKPEGLVYADTPFLQNAHMGQYDFTRFTFVGHRRLFRWFQQLDAGISCGPGMALANSIVYFLRSFPTGRRLRSGLTLLGRLLTFWLKYCDLYLVSREGAYDAASAFYFMGMKSTVRLGEREVLEQYRGGARL